MSFRMNKLMDVGTWNTSNVNVGGAYLFSLWPRSHAISSKYGVTDRMVILLNLLVKFGIEIDYMKESNKYLYFEQ